MHNWYIDGGPEILGTIEANIVHEPIIDPEEGYDPTFRVLIVESPDGVNRVHCKWVSAPYCRATWELIEDQIQIVPMEKDAPGLVPGDRFMLLAFNVRVISQDYKRAWTTMVRDETFGDKFRYYWARGNIWLGKTEVVLVHHLNKIGLASTPEACWPTYGDIVGVRRGKYLWRRMTKILRSWKSAAEDTLSKISSAG